MGEKLSKTKAYQKTSSTLERAKVLRRKANKAQGAYEISRYRQKNSPNPISEKEKKTDERLYKDFIEANKEALTQYRKYADELLGKYGNRKVSTGLFSRKKAKDILIENLLNSYK